MEAVTVATCSRTNCSCRGARSDSDAGVKLTFGVGKSHGGGPGGTSAAGISKSRLRSTEEIDRIRERPAGSMRNRSSGTEGRSDQLRVVGREIWEIEALNSEPSDIEINCLDQRCKT